MVLSPESRPGRLGTVLLLALGPGCADGTAGNIGPGGAANRLAIAESGAHIEIQDVIGGMTRSSTAAPTVTAVMSARLSAGSSDAPATGWSIEVDLDLDGLFRNELPFDAPANLRTSWSRRSGLLVASSTPTAGGPIDGGRLRRICAACASGPAAQKWTGNLRILYVDATRFEGRLEVAVEGGVDTAPEPSRTLSVSAFFDVPLP